MVTIDHVRAARERMGETVHRTPLLESTLLNRLLGHRIVFKAENLQKIGAFKARGALNTLLVQKERGELPASVVSHSSGNHAQAVAWACGEIGIPCTVFMPESASSIKQQATRAYGASVRTVPTRQEAEAGSAEMAREGAMLLHPYDRDEVIAGQGTAALEVLDDGLLPTALFTPCGGGGLLSGSTVTFRELAPKTAIFGVEPVSANDAARSYRSGCIYRFDEAPRTLADGVQTLSLSERTFRYIRRTDGILEVDEEAIVYWTQWLTHLLKVTLEPTAVLGMTGAASWLSGRKKKETVLVILTGGNLSAETRAQVWKKDLLGILPEPAVEGD
jgi:threonine dehydratase